MTDVDLLQDAEEARAQLDEDRERERAEAFAAELAEPPIIPTAEHPRRAAVVPLRELRAGENIRPDPGDLEELALSIRQRGLVTPLIVRATGDASVPYTVVDGHRRLAALRLLSLPEGWPVRCEVVDDLTDEAEIAELQLLALHRCELPPLQVARAFRLVLDRREGLTAAALARSLGRRPAWAQQHLRLLELPAEVLARIEAGDLSLTVADLLRRGQSSGRIAGPELVRLAERAADGDATTREVREAVGSPRHERERPPWEDDEPLDRRERRPVEAEAPEPTTWQEAAPPTELTRRQVYAYLLGRLVHDYAPDDWLAERGLQRHQVYEHAWSLTPEERMRSLVEVTHQLLLGDPSAGARRILQGADG
jgi:ParB family chromosome partitioning protein